MIPLLFPFLYSLPGFIISFLFFPLARTILPIPPSDPFLPPIALYLTTMSSLDPPKDKLSEHTTPLSPQKFTHDTQGTQPTQATQPFDDSQLPDSLEGTPDWLSLIPEERRPYVAGRIVMKRRSGHLCKTQDSGEGRG